MTIERNGTGTARYIPPSGGPNLDAFGLANPAQPSPLRSAAPGPPLIDIQYTAADKARVTMTFYDASWGIGPPRGYFDELHNKLKTSTLDHSYEEHLVLPQLQTTQNTPDFRNATSGWYTFHTATLSRVLGILHNGALGGAVCLVRETSATDPTIVDTQYTPGSDVIVTGMWGPFVMEGAAGVIVGRGGVGAHFLSNFNINTPTVLDTMHSNTASLNGVIETTLPDPHWLFYTGGNIYGLPRDADRTDAPSLIATDLPNCDNSIGLLSLGGAEARAYWHVNDAQGTSALGPHTGYIMSTKQNGLDPQWLRFPLPTVRQALIARHGIVATDGNRTVYMNGRIVRDLHNFSNRVANSDLQESVYSLCAPNEWDLYALIVRWRATGSSAGSTQARVEKYDWERGAWYGVSENKTLATPSGALPAGFTAPWGMPFADANEFLHWYLEDGTSNAQTWYRQKLMQPGVNPYTKRKTAGASSGTGLQYAPAGVAESASMTVRELDGWQFCLRRVIGPPQENIDACGTGGTPGSISVAVADRQGAFNTAWTATFRAGEPAGRKPYRDFASKQFAYEIAYRVTMTQQASGTDPTRHTGNAFPFTLVFDARRPPALPSVEFGDWTA